MLVLTIKLLYYILFIPWLFYFITTKSSESFYTGRRHCRPEGCCSLPSFIDTQMVFTEKIWFFFFFVLFYFYWQAFCCYYFRWLLIVGLGKIQRCIRLKFGVCRKITQNKLKGFVSIIMNWTSTRTNCKLLFVNILIWYSKTKKFHLKKMLSLLLMRVRCLFDANRHSNIRYKYI